MNDPISDLAGDWSYQVPERYLVQLGMRCPLCGAHAKDERVLDIDEIAAAIITCGACGFSVRMGAAS